MRRGFSYGSASPGGALGSKTYQIFAEESLALSVTVMGVSYVHDALFALTVTVVAANAGDAAAANATAAERREAKRCAVRFIMGCSGAFLPFGLQSTTSREEINAFCLFRFSHYYRQYVGMI